MIPCPGGYAAAVSRASDPVSVLLRRVRRPGGGEPFDVLIRGGRVASMHDGGSGPGVVGTDGGVEPVDADGAYLVPGLWDAHVHMQQWALLRERLDVSAASSAAQVLRLVADHLAARDAGDRGPLNVFGFRDGLWPDEPSLAALDAVAGEVPVVIVSGDVHSAWVNGAGARLLGVAVGADGMVREGPWFEASRDYEEAPEALREQLVARAARAAAGRGVTGIVDLELADNVFAWQDRIAAGVDQLRVRAGCYPDRLEQAIAAGLPTGAVVDGTGGLLTVGPLKIISDGALNTRTAHCRHAYPDGGHGVQEWSREQMLDLVTRAHRAGLATSIHAIGDRANTIALDVFAAAGVGGSIEHAQLIDAADVPRFAELGVTASVQPEHLLDDRDVADVYWPGRTMDAFPLASLAASGARIRFGSDAPVSPLDPWLGISAAVARTKDEREPWHPEQRIGAALALACAADGRDAVRVGDVADLVLVGADPLGTDPVRGLREMPVLATMVGGRFTHRDGI
ncbi:amidohydrolase [Occultella aeris]|uniref:N-substituted formamide deformylase n=1 Tax=Occultella aeris TaxID=2761496 RepID=A0A7M4DFA6_9MICO|nr:N-substituted formamide deformylase precursor [Occultella aeris]